MTTYIDTHCHLDLMLKRLGLSSYGELEAKYPESFSACIHVSCEPGSLETAASYLSLETVYGIAGLHPHDSQHYDGIIEARIQELMSLPKILAWGEIGLDYHYDLSPRETQRRVFLRQLDRALDAKKPIVIHTREAESDTLEIMSSCIPSNWNVHLHCYTSPPSLAEALLHNFTRLYFGFTGAVTFRNTLDIHETVRLVPLNRILAETDAPYMTPVPHRGEPCHSGHTPFIIERIAELKDIEPEKAYQQIRENTRKMYGI